MVTADAAAAGRAVRGGSTASGSVLHDAAPLAEVIRGDLVESVHLGHLVVLDPAGRPVLQVGNPTTPIWPRSSLKPVQLLAMLRAGLELPDRLLALASASHNGERFHLEGVLQILASVGLGVEALQNTPDLPLHPPAALDWHVAPLVGGPGPSSLTQNCSGKHAAMLATCLVQGWDIETYLSPEHPLQRAVRGAVLEMTGDAEVVMHTTVDGCGAPLFSTTLLGLARAFSTLGAAPTVDVRSHEARVARAVSAHPEMVGGTGRDVTLAMQAVPGLIAKDGAEGVYAAGLPDGSALAFKVLDGSARARPAILAAALRAAGAAGLPGVYPGGLDGLGRVPVLGGGRPVGEVRAVFADAYAEGRR
ncbi:asparaginase [Promicromonospora thailandica]|uniref:Asparaginase n=1 Tax=Promicromonospora thailandica TaxID=765201 RepID=A0A9X2JWR9_9MICO|nr:asparaginase [Promicromonospora thailandica]MCP2266431.1 asparaginase [Promicromonospora thailandica]BFF20113.1 asparaginase [Promicromonospora thailandica]